MIISANRIENFFYNFIHFRKLVGRFLFSMIIKSSWQIKKLTAKYKSIILIPKNPYLKIPKYRVIPKNQFQSQITGFWVFDPEKPKSENPKIPGYSKKSIPIPDPGILGFWSQKPKSENHKIPGYSKRNTPNSKNRDFRILIPKSRNPKNHRNILSHCHL